MSLSSSYSDNDEISKPHKGENESDNEFSDFGKGWVPIQGEITLPKLNTGDMIMMVKMMRMMLVMVMIVCRRLIMWNHIFIGNFQNQNQLLGTCDPIDRVLTLIAIQKCKKMFQNKEKFFFCSGVYGLNHFYDLIKYTWKNVLPWIAALVTMVYI